MENTENEKNQGLILAGEMPRGERKNGDKVAK